MDDPDSISAMLQTLEGMDQRSPRLMKTASICFPDDEAAAAYCADIADLGFATTIKEEPPVSVQEWEETLREADLPSDLSCEEMGPFRTWRVEASTGTPLALEQLAEALGRMNAAAKDRGGFLCSVTFPD